MFLRQALDRIHQFSADQLNGLSDLLCPELINHMDQINTGNRGMVTTSTLPETAMYRVKQLLGGKLSLRDHNAQVGETYAMVKALNKLTGLGMPKTCRIG
ncbi:transposase domain protein [Vibrio cholerae HE48]|nr:transposase domain protein [Vibrio cholerae HE48]